MHKYIPLLKQADIFDQLNETQLELIAQLCRERTYQMGEMIFPEGARSDELYVIAQGEVDILVNPALVSRNQEEPRAQATIATLRRGQSFGEIALVDQGLRSASARSVQSGTRVLVIARASLDALCEQYPQLGYRLMRNLAADLALKIRDTGLRMREELLYGRREKLG